MGRTLQAVFLRIAKRRHMRVDLKTPFVTRDVESYYATSLKPFDGPSCLESLFGAGVAGSATSPPDTCAFFAPTMSFDTLTRVTGVSVLGLTGTCPNAVAATSLL